MDLTTNKSVPIFALGQWLSTWLILTPRGPLDHSWGQ